MTKLHTAAVLGALLVPVAGQSPAEQKKAPQHLLRLSFADGPTWWRVRQDMVASSDVSGAMTAQRLRFELFWKTAVRRTDGDAAVVSYTLARVRGALRENDGGVSSFDSATDSSAPAGLGEFIDLIDTEIALTTDALGRVVKLELPDRLQRLDGMSGPQLIKASDMIRPFALELPELPVAVGARWSGSNDRELAANDELAVESEYELVGVEKGQVRIQHRFTVKSAAGAKKSEAAVRREKLDSLRTFVLDLGTGRVVRVEADTKLVTPLNDRFNLKVSFRRQSEPTVEPGDLEPLEPPPVDEKEKK